MLRNKLFQPLVDAVLSALAPVHMQQAVDSQSLYICRVGGLTPDDTQKYSRIIGMLLNKTLKTRPSTTNSIAFDEARATWTVSIPVQERKQQVSKAMVVELVRGVAASQLMFLELWVSLA